MTRINLIPVRELTREHLVAEYKEIMRLPGSLKKSLNRKSKPFCFSEIPPQYVLGKGHVKFFYDKFKWAEKRFLSLVTEMKRRGYEPTFGYTNIFKVEPRFYNDWKPSLSEINLSQLRINERLK